MFFKKDKHENSNIEKYKVEAEKLYDKMVKNKSQIISYVNNAIEDFKKKLTAGYVEQVFCEVNDFLVKNEIVVYHNTGFDIIARFKLDIYSRVTITVSFLDYVILWFNNESDCCNKESFIDLLCNKEPYIAKKFISKLGCFINMFDNENAYWGDY